MYATSAGTPTKPGEWAGWEAFAISLVVGVAAAILETFSKWGIDNLLVPLGSAGLAFVLNSFLS